MLRHSLGVTIILSDLSFNEQRPCIFSILKPTRTYILRLVYDLVKSVTISVFFQFTTDLASERTLKFGKCLTKLFMYESSVLRPYCSTSRPRVVKDHFARIFVALHV